MTQELVKEWILAGPLMAFGCLLAFANIYRHIGFHLYRKKQGHKLGSGIPFIGNLSFFYGLYASPLDFQWVYLLFLLTEIASFNFYSTQINKND